MKALFLASVIFTVFCHGAFATGNDFLLVHQSDGKVSSIIIDSLQKITFTGDSIVILRIDDNSLKLPWAAVSKFTFDDEDVNHTGIANVDSATDGMIYYNRTSGSIIVSSTTPIGEVRVYNLQGALVKRDTVQSSQAEIPVSSLPDGIYIVKTGSGVKKVVKY
jgi:hypothetical protein